MDALIVIAILVAGIAAESHILSRARRRSEREDEIVSRLARYAGRRL